METTIGFRVQGSGLGFKIQELSSSYCIGEALLITIYTHYGNLIYVL